MEGHANHGSNCHPTKGAGADNFPGAQPGPTSSHPTASSASNSSSSQSHNQQQYHHNMFTLNSSQAGASLASQAAFAEPGESLPQQTASIPRSALNRDTMSSSESSSITNTSGKSDTLGYRNINIEFPACSQSSLSMELTHDGKVTELVARFESYTNYSDESKESHDDHVCTSIIATRCSSDPEAQTVRGTDDEHKRTIDDDGEEQQGPRKPLPAHWLPKSHGPNLATARRAKERSHKTEVHGLGTTVMTIRGTRSSLDLGKHGTESTTFLTKEALAAVENNLTTTPSHSPSKNQQSPSKQSRRSSNASPQRNSTDQHSKFTIKMSPTRKAFLNADLAPSGHSRASSSVTTSVGGNSFHTAEGSPVRSSAGSDVSFESAAETLEEEDTGHDDTSANGVNVQGAGSPRKGALSPLKTAQEVKSNPVKPKLSLVFPLSPSCESDDQAARALNSATTNSIAAVIPSNQNSSGQTSRIPRVSATNKTGSARGATRSSTLKRVQSVKSLSPKTKAPENHSADPDPLKSPNTSAVVSPRHVPTIDSSVQTRPNELEKPTTNEYATVFAGDSTQEDVTVSKQPTRAASNTSINATLQSQDTVLGTKCDVLGASHENDAPCVTASVASEPECATNVMDIPSPVRGRTELYRPGARRQEESQHSMHSSSGSDLRATAPEFVPMARAALCPDTAPADLTTESRSEPGTDLDMFGLDKHGIPWAYYMYPIQFAYEQGFRNGRSKSPRKFKPKKPRSLVPSSADLQNQPQRGSFPATDIKLDVDPSFPVTQCQSDAILMPPPPVPASRFQRLAKGENSRPGLMGQYHPKSKVDVNDRDGTFAPRADMAAQQPALDEFTNRHTPQFSNFGPAAMHSVPFISGPRDIKSPRYTNMSYRGPRHNRRNTGNGLYSGRGTAGVPMDATFPFPDPMPPQGRPDQSQIHPNSLQQPAQYSMDSEACGTVDILIAAERGGGEACNACAPDH